MVLEIINSCLCHTLQHNINLVYTLLYQKHLFAHFSTHPSFQDIIQNIDTVSSVLCVTRFEMGNFQLGNMNRMPFIYTF